MTTMKKFRWFWAWEDEKEESWLREMSQQGWHFKSVSIPHNYTFEQGEPTDYVYRLDYFIDQKNVEEYQQIFEDAGWDYMGKMSGWQYFRQEAVHGQELEIFTDNSSKAKKYQRLTLSLSAILPVFLFTFSIAGNGIYRAATLLMGLIFVFYAYTMIRLLLRISQLRKKV